MADMSHISGLVAAGVHASPFPFTDVVTTTTHKTLRGPRGAMIFCKDEFKERIEKAVFPGMQGGPHEHTIAGIAVALKEGMQPEFKTYAEQVIKNSQALAEGLLKEGIRLISGGSDNHLLLIDLRPINPGLGAFYEKALDAVHINTNKSPLPNDPAPPFYPSGIRLGTPPLTIRGMKEGEMAQVARWIGEVVREFKEVTLPEDKTFRKQALKDFSASLKNNQTVKRIADEVQEMAGKFPVPGID